MTYRSETRDIRMMLAGDVMLSRRLTPFGEPAYLDLVERIRAADLSFANFESTVRERHEGHPVFQQGTPMTTPPTLLEDMKWMGFDILSLANNHASDYGVGGMLATIKHLRQSNIAFAGLGENLAEARAPVYLDTIAGRVGLVAANAFFSAPGTHAGEQRRDSPGRPGINPLRFESRYTVDKNTLETLRAASERLGFSQDRARKRNLFFSENEMPTDKADRIDFLGQAFELGETFKVTTRADPIDRTAIANAVSEARAQADWVIFSVHFHEMGDGGRTEARRMIELSDPAAFVVEMAHAAIDAGADVVVGHGPHLTLGIELYKSRPIFYSLGNFALQNDTVEVVPAESYQRFGLADDARPSDFFATRNGNDTRGFPATREYWEGVVAEIQFRAGAVTEIKLLPLDLGFGQPRSQRGRPTLASGLAAERTIGRLVEFSRRHGTEISSDGTIHLK